LLPVKRDGEGDRFLGDIGLRRIACDICAAVVLCEDTLGTKVAHCVIAEVEEVLSPNLHPSVSILGSPARLDGIDLRHIEEAEWY
jgi:hypothetical protein